MSEDIKTLYKVVDKLEQRIKTNEDKINAFSNDIDEVVKVLTKMKKELYYTVEEDEAMKTAAKNADDKRYEQVKEAMNKAETINIMKNVTNKGEDNNDS